MLSRVSFALVCAMACWFSATAVLPELADRWTLSPGQSAWLTNAVQLGFVVGALSASFVNLPDILPLPRLMAISALLAAVSNATLLLEPAWILALLARFTTGFALAGVYPPAMKLVASWFRSGRGIALGVLIGAITLGSSMPHLVRAASFGLDWRAVIGASSLAGFMAAAIFAILTREGPFTSARARFDPRRILDVFRNKPLLLANIGYFGHMWELYAMWAWMLAFLSAAGQGGATLFGNPSLAVFIVIASGTIGSIIGGILSDRIGRCLTTVGMMVTSASCAAMIGFAFNGPLWILGLIAIIWGASVIGDSAQFSAAVTELAEPQYIGTALAVQVGLGFGLTVLAIWAMPLIAAFLGSWQWIFVALLPGPVIGAAAMYRLRGLPEAHQLAQGRR